MDAAVDDDLSWLLRPTKFVMRRDVVFDRSAIPDSPGVYGWYFDDIPPGLDQIDVHRHGGRALLYVGISPRRPPVSGKMPRTLRQRVVGDHCTGNAEGSTLRLTLGCLLAGTLGFKLRRVGSGKRLTFTNPGEQALDDWLDRHAYLTFREHPEPWVVEEAILRSVIPLPLNIQGRIGQGSAISKIRAAARAEARSLPIVADSGGPRRK